MVFIDLEHEHKHIYQMQRWNEWLESFSVSDISLKESYVFCSAFVYT